MSLYLDPPRRSLGRAASLCAVLLLHAAILALVLARSGVIRSFQPAITPARILPPDHVKPPPPPPIDSRLLPPPALLPVALPEVNVAPSPASDRAPKVIVRVGPAHPTASHFGGDSGGAGLGVGVGANGAGGARARGGLEDFEAAVKRAILRHKVQPTLAWDRRNTCVVNYTASVATDGSLASFHIDPCAVPEINQAARDAIQAAAPFPRPPDLGGQRYDVHGTLIFHP